MLAAKNRLQDELARAVLTGFGVPLGMLDLSPEQPEGHYGDYHPTFKKTGRMEESHTLLHALPEAIDRIKLRCALIDARNQQKGTIKMTPFLVIATVPAKVEGEQPKVLYYSKDAPVFAAKAQDARQVGFAAAVRADPDVDPSDVKVFVLPFV